MKNKATYESYGIMQNMPTSALWGFQKKERKKDKYIKNVFEDMAENFPNLRKETDVQVQEVQRVSNKINPNRLSPKHN